jgi:hypothetical protein
MSQIDDSVLGLAQRAAYKPQRPDVSIVCPWIPLEGKKRNRLISRQDRRAQFTPQSDIPLRKQISHTQQTRPPRLRTSHHIHIHFPLFSLSLSTLARTAERRRRVVVVVG